MIIDSHAHLDARILDPARMIEKMDAAGVDRVVLIPAMNDPLPATPARLLAFARQASQTAAGRLLFEGIHRALLTPEGDLRLNGEVVRLYSRPDNAPVARLVAAHPDRFWGWIFLNPRNNPRVLDELEAWRAEPGMIGVKLHPHWHDYRTEVLSPLLRRVEELGLPIMIHLGFRKRGDFRSICAEFPKLRVISAHAGFPFYRDLWRYRAECPNLFVDLSSPYIDEPLARAAVAAMGPERCFYGTDAPYGFHEGDGSYDYRAILGWVERMPITSQAQARVLGAGFLELLDAGPRARA